MILSALLVSLPLAAQVHLQNKFSNWQLDLGTFQPVLAGVKGQVTLSGMFTEVLKTLDVTGNWSFDLVKGVPALTGTRTA